jgi:hypothetical protein
MNSAREAGLKGVEARVVADVGDGGVSRYAGVLACDAGGLVADLATVDLVSRLALTARQGDCRLWLRRVSPRLMELLLLAGLDDVLMRSPDADLERGGEPEQREELGVEERGDLGDPPV